MSLDTEQEATRKTALDQLKFTKNRKSLTTTVDSAPSSSPSVGSIQVQSNTPPAQSRDATVSSRYFPSTPLSQGTILVPDSSPLNPDSHYRPYQPYNHVRSHDVAAIPNTIQASHWGPLNGSFGGDPLSAPSGFTGYNGSPYASIQRQWGDMTRRVSDVEDMRGEGPPRKRMRGSSQDAPDVTNSPDSPGIQRIGQRRRIAHNGVTGPSVSSDESMPEIHDLFEGPSRPRIVNGRADSYGSPTLTTDQPSAEDPKLTGFAMTMPQHPKAVVRLAWLQAGGDVKKASDLLQDRVWLKNPSGTVQPPPDVVGRVKEIDEATRAQRAAAKEMGKQSLIYANRPAPALRISPPSTPQTISHIPTSPATPLSPEICRPRAKRARKTTVIDSDSETEAEDQQHIPKRQKVTSNETRALDYLNNAGADGLQELTGCTPPQAAKIIELRPFHDVDDLNTKLGQGRKKAGPGGISPRMFQDCTATFEGYGMVDGILEDCEDIGIQLRDIIASWTSTGTKGKGKQKESHLSSETSSRGSPAIGQLEDGALSLVSLEAVKANADSGLIPTQPASLREGTKLKDYQLLGISWLNLLYRRNLSCILADEMGLGKTIQVISFFAHLKEQGSKGPHLVVVPSSTLENWLREFKQFAPDITVMAYYAGKEERPRLRQDLLESQASTSTNGVGWEVLVTTYNLAQGDDRDRKFFRRVEWDTCVFDEGHVLKNFQSQRYQSLVKYGSKWRLLLTGTPLQNNLQELVSLMNFILPLQFEGALESLRAIFKVKGDSKVSLLAQERVSRAKKMMTPFVLRRRKDQVLKDLPNKTERIEWCEMTGLQRSIYNDALQRSRKTIFDVEADTATPPEGPTQNGKAVKKKIRANVRPKDKVYLENSSNVLMDLRKASLHPMLFRRRFTDQTLTAVTKLLLKEPDFKKRGAVFQFVKEDMEVMTDAELQIFVAEYKATRKYMQKDSCYLDAGKITVLLKLLEDYIKQGRKVLIFSQFTQILDILQAILDQRDINYLILKGTTAVDTRQALVDRFTKEDMKLPVFLLSTKAGGMGINLTAASVVILFDQDFNPHNDKQAQDRAYRIGQKRDVEVVKLITRGTIEEDMLKLGQTKLALDDAVAGDTEEGDSKGESAPVREMKTSLMNVLRKQFEQQSSSEATASEEKIVGGTTV